MLEYMSSSRTFRLKQILRAVTFTRIEAPLYLEVRTSLTNTYYDKRNYVR